MLLSNMAHSIVEGGIPAGTLQGRQPRSQGDTLSAKLLSTLHTALKK